MFLTDGAGAPVIKHDSLIMCVYVAGGMCSPGKHRSLESFVQAKAIDLLRPLLGHKEAVNRSVFCDQVDRIGAVRAVEAALGPFGKGCALLCDRAGNWIDCISNKICNAREHQVAVDIKLFTERDRHSVGPYFIPPCGGISAHQVHVRIETEGIGRREKLFIEIEQV